MIRRALRLRSDEDLLTWARKLAFRLETRTRVHWRAREYRRRPPRWTTSEEWAREMAAPSVSAAVSAVCERPLGGLGSTGAGLLELLRRDHPDEVQVAVDEAEALLRGRYRVFGETFDLGLEPDWRRDPSSGARWSGFGPALDVIRLDQSSDVRVLWELNRGHHLVRLAQASLLTSERRFADRAAALVRHWMVENPPGEGPNWSCAMEPALRAVNWIWLLLLLRSTGWLEPELMEAMLPALWDHARFVEANLEGRPGLRNSNHYLADGLGLLYLGRFFAPSSRARGWVRRGGAILWSELPRQVLPDGVNHEMTTSYHRLVAEMYLHAVMLERGAGTPPPAIVEERLRRMVIFAAHYLRPDGLAPAWGDQDDARVVPFAVRPPGDHGHILEAGRVLLGVEVPSPSPAGRFEAVWLTASAPSVSRPGSVGSRAFPHAGVYVLRNDGDHVFFDCGPYGAHGHADALSFELSANGRPIVVDSGTYSYTLSLEVRDAFRCTAAHNTVTLANRDSSLLEANCLWGSRRGARVAVRRLELDDSRDLVEAEHYGYLHLPQRAIHRRRLVLDKVSRTLVVADEIEGRGEIEVAVHFHFAPGLDVAVAGDLCSVRERDGGHLLTLQARAPGLGRRLEACEVSDRYLACRPATVLRFAGRLELPTATEYVFRLGGADSTA